MEFQFNIQISLCTFTSGLHMNVFPLSVFFVFSEDDEKSFQYCQFVFVFVLFCLVCFLFAIGRFVGEQFFSTFSEENKTNKLFF